MNIPVLRPHHLSRQTLTRGQGLCFGASLNEVEVQRGLSNNWMIAEAVRLRSLASTSKTSTEAAMAAFQRRKFDLVVSDMGRGDNMRAGYGWVGPESAPEAVGEGAVGSTSQYGACRIA